MKSVRSFALKYITLLAFIVLMTYEYNGYIAKAIYQPLAWMWLAVFTYVNVFHRKGEKHVS